MSMPSPLPVTLADYERLARSRMSEGVDAFINGGAGDEITLRANSAAFDRIAVASAVLADMRGAHTRTRLLGLNLEHPILLAPVAYHRLVHPDGEIATAQGAGAAGAPLVVSTQASVSIEDVARAASAPLWFQLYIQADRGFTAALVERAEAAGYGALVLTVDAPASLRAREHRAGFRLPPGVSAVNLQGVPVAPTTAPAITESPLFSGFLANAPRWEDIAWLKSQTRLPLLLKGILSPGDALRALDHGADGLIVSNHGGRILDGLPATIEALPAVRTAVAGRVPVLLDGGIRRGTDILKALALGADAVLIGRPYMHGLAAAGPAGIAHVVHLLRAELELAMAITGSATLADIGPEVLFAR